MYWFTLYHLEGSVVILYSDMLAVDLSVNFL